MYYVENQERIYYFVYPQKVYRAEKGLNYEIILCAAHALIE